ncbi:DNA-binding response regulator [Kaistia sp. 32K]|uniref:response regulator FixJ n=1 Tax=Kaistia sp. 32K TaxID=2795690 RepID=UPI001916A10C|nr:response regulator FixJ [Kaistia sp. 32K]BCP53692.1 DNA-binding response regulator [Kaistia sp. 32K]
MSAEAVIHVIDDDDAARDSLAFLFESADLEVRSYASAAAFLTEAPGLVGGCIVTDVRMPEINGIEMLKRLKAQGVSLPVIVITGHADIALAVEAMKSGAVDFMEKPFDDEAMLRAVRAALVRHGKTLEAGQERAEIRRRLGVLSNREQQVLEGLVAGHANKRIAHDLDISPRTVEIYRAHVMTKMEAASLSELVRMALIVGLNGSIATSDN